MRDVIEMGHVKVVVTDGIVTIYGEGCTLRIKTNDIISIRMSYSDKATVTQYRDWSDDLVTKIIPRR